MDRFLHQHHLSSGCIIPSTYWHSNTLSHILWVLRAGTHTSKKVSLHCKQYCSLLGLKPHWKICCTESSGTVILGRKQLVKGMMSDRVLCLGGRLWVHISSLFQTRYSDTVARASVIHAWISALLSFQLFATEPFPANRNVSTGLGDVPNLIQALRALPCAVKLSSSSSLQWLPVDFI